MIEPLQYPGSLADFRNFISRFQSNSWERAFETGPGNPIKPAELASSPDYLGFLVELATPETGLGYWQYELQPLPGNLRYLKALIVRNSTVDFPHYEPVANNLVVNLFEGENGPLGCALIIAQQIRPDETIVDFLDGRGFFKPGDANFHRGPECGRPGTPPPAGKKLYYFREAGAEFRDLIDSIVTELVESQPVVEKDPANRRFPYGLQDETKRKLQVLAKFRADFYHEQGYIPKREIAYGAAQISHKTAKKHASVLMARWNDIDFLIEDPERGVLGILVIS